MTKLPRMTKSQFEYLADILNKTRPSMVDVQRFHQWAYVASMFGSALNRTNPNFDFVKWYDACGLRDEGEVTSLAAERLKESEPVLFRSGTAIYDCECGEQVVAWDVDFHAGTCLTLRNAVL